MHNTSYWKSATGRVSNVLKNSGTNRQCWHCSPNVFRKI